MEEQNLVRRMHELVRRHPRYGYLANDPAHRDRFNQPKAELFRLQAELGDSPDNKGDRPDIGEPKP